MDGTLFTKRWLLTYSLLCASLLVCGSVSGQLADWSATVIGGATDCDSQDNLTQELCVAVMGRNCTEKFEQCNQGAGNATRICQEEGGPDESCAVGSGQVTCEPRNDDELSEFDAMGNPCTPVQIP